MTDKQRIAALREALQEAITERGAMGFRDAGPYAALRLAAINSTALRALRDDDHAEIAGGEQ
jgi:hypothetical protein